MSLNLPPVIAAYFDAANNQDPDRLTACFAPDAVVEDEDRRHVGLAAISSWKEESFAKYRPMHEPKSWNRDGEVVTVVSTVSGNFPGSPVDLRHEFTLDGESIVLLTIGLA